MTTAASTWLTTFRGIENSPAFVRTSEGSGCVVRFIRTPKRNRPWVRTSDSGEDLRLALPEFRETCNTTWLIERQGSRPPATIRDVQLHPAAMAAKILAFCLTNCWRYTDAFAASVQETSFGHFGAGATARAVTDLVDVN